jgi:hypothetical protein
LIDPGFDDTDFFRSQGSGRGHLEPKSSGYAQIKRAGGAVAGENDAPVANVHRIATTVQAEILLLFHGAMTPEAVLSQQRLNVTGKIHSSGGLRKNRFSQKTYPEEDTDHSRHSCSFSHDHIAGVGEMVLLSSWQE